MVAMPNTTPAVDEPSIVRYVAEKGRVAGGARVQPSGAVTGKREGRRITEMLAMKEEGAVLLPTTALGDFV